MRIYTVWFTKKTAERYFRDRICAMEMLHPRLVAEYLAAHWTGVEICHLQ